VLALRERDPIADDGARLIRVVWCVGDDRGAIRARQLERILQMFQVRRIGYLSGYIGQPDIDPKGRQAAAEGSIAAARIESDPRQYES
jgi:hypothetical protein